MQRNKNGNEQQPKAPANNKLRGDRHLMFTKVVPQYDIEVLAIKSATLYLSTMMENKINLAELLNEISDFGPDDKIKIVINSPGGRVSEGKSLINSLLSTGSKITTELISDAASMAAVLFCVGHKRVAYENSGIMFHTFSSGYIGKGGEMKDYIKHTSKNLNAFFKAHIIGLTDEEIDKW
jgi:ATP-dependent protease ClpP protease subunit